MYMRKYYTAFRGLESQETRLGINIKYPPETDNNGCEVFKLAKT